MGTCINCGKKGLFLKVNNRGLCNECELQFVKDKPEEHYRTLLTLFTSIRETVSMPEDPIERLGYIDKLEKKLLECKRLKEEAEKIQGNKTLGKYIIRRTIYKSASDASLGRSILENFDNLTIWTGKYTADDPCKKLSEELIKKSEKYFDGWQRTINMVKNNAEFEKELREIPEVEIKKSHKSVEMKSTVDLEFLVKYSRITTKTNYNRIGNFVVIDTETTGLSSLKDAITEISAIKFEDWTPIQVFHTMINPLREIPEEITNQSGITNEMVNDAPLFYEIIPCLDEFIGSSALVGHNLPFDLKFVYRNGYDFTAQKRKYYDTLDLIKTVLKRAKSNYDVEYDVDNYKLTTLCDYYCIRDNKSAHRSTSDALATGILFDIIAKKKTDYIE